MWSDASDATDGIREEEDPFVGDLNNWEFLTVFFDHDDFLGEQIPTPSNTSGSTDEKPKNAFTAPPVECRLDTFHQDDCILSRSSNPVSTSFIQQPSNVDRVPSVPLGDDSHHPYGILSNNFSMSSLRPHEHQAISDFPNRHRALLPSSISLHYPNSSNFGIPGVSTNESFRCNRAVERLNVRRVPMDIGSCSNGTYSSGQFTREFSAPFQFYSHGCSNETVISRYCLEGDETRMSMKQDGLFFHYSPPLPNHDLLKPLTAYNFFYRDERDNIIGGMQTDGDPIPPALSDFSEAKLRQMLDQRWYIDPRKKKRSHRKTHGKLPFETLSKIIGLRWQELSEEGREFYRWIAKLDQAQYRKFILAKEATVFGKSRAHTL